MSEILSQIIANKRREVEAAKKQRPLTTLKALIETVPPARDFHKALRKNESTRIIAECKHKSPSKGILKTPYDPVALAVAYERGGAAAISVLTDEAFFGGDLTHLEQVKQAVRIPVLRKDFIVDEYQIYEARRYGADTFLLLAGTLDTAELQYFLEIGRDLDMEALVESHNQAELTMALKTDAKILGINNRDLNTMTVNTKQSLDLVKFAKKYDPKRLLVCESGIHSRAQLKAAESLGFQAFLIGEHLVTHENPEKAILDLLV